MAMVAHISANPCRFNAKYLSKAVTGDSVDRRTSVEHTASTSQAFAIRMSMDVGGYLPIFGRCSGPKLYQSSDMPVVGMREVAISLNRSVQASFFALAEGGLQL